MNNVHTPTNMDICVFLWTYCPNGFKFSEHIKTIKKDVEQTDYHGVNGITYRVTTNQKTGKVIEFYVVESNTDGDE